MMTRITLIAAVAVLATSMAAQAGLTLTGTTTGTTIGAYDVFVVSAEWDGNGTPLQTLNYQIDDVHNEWLEVVAGAVYLESKDPGDNGYALVDSTIDSHLMLTYTGSAAWLTIASPAETIVPIGASGEGSMSGNIGYKGVAPTDTTTDLFQVAVPTGAGAPYTIRLTDGDGNKNDFTGIIGVPEPATMALLGLGAVAMIRRRK